MNSRSSSRLAGCGLAFAAALVWCRDLGWLSEPADALPLFVGIPLAWWLGRPWVSLTNPDLHGKALPVLAAAGGFAAGWMVSSLTLLAMAWTALACCWVTTFHQPRPGRGRMICLLALSFPWLVLEWQHVGWWFRISSASAAEGFFQLLRMPVIREGVRLNVIGVPVQVEAACAGWNLLQLTLLAGVTMGIREIGANRKFLVFLFLLPVLSWLANFIRILALTGIALSFDVQAADGAFHGITGLLVIVGVIAMTRFLCMLIDPPVASTSRIVHAS